MHEIDQDRRHPAREEQGPRQAHPLLAAVTAHQLRPPLCPPGPHVLLERQHAKAAALGAPGEQPPSNACEPAATAAARWEAVLDRPGQLGLELVQLALGGQACKFRVEQEGADHVARHPQGPPEL